YVEATGDDTEARLLNRLHKSCRGLSPSLTLRESIAALRRSQQGKKVLIVLDQFEQWLHPVGQAALPASNPALVPRGRGGEELIDALRQCDGEHIQCIVMVRDDFWMAATRFMQALEIDLTPGRNVAAVDLFDLRHATKVLSAFGRAFGALPQHPNELDKAQKA